MIPPPASALPLAEPSNVVRVTMIGAIQDLMLRQVSPKANLSQVVG